MILFGMSYGVRVGAHLGVDAFVRMFPTRLFRAVAIFGALACILYTAILLGASWLNVFGAHTKGGAMLYWSTVYRTHSGLDEMKWPQLIIDTFGFNERLPRWSAYLMLPAGLGLFGLRSAQALLQIVRGERELMIASHEAEDLVAENKAILEE